eukprot:gene6968-7518_t
MASDLDYLPGIIPFTFGVVLLLAFIIVILFIRVDSFCCGFCECRRNIPIGDNPQYSLFQRFTHGYSFEHVYGSALQPFLGQKRSMYLLLLIRALSFAFFFAVPFIWNFIRRHEANAYYFTLWNIDLITTFYFFVTISSMIGCYYHEEIEEKRSKTTPRPQDDVEHQDGKEEVLAEEIELFWSIYTLRFGYLIQILFEVTGSTAFFITVINFLLLDSSMEFWNVSYHLITTLSLLIEIAFNHLIVRPEHVIFTILWALIYLIFIWPQVATENVRHWPYFFLNAKTPVVFVWYIGLIAALMIFYYIFWFVTNVKYSLVLSALRRSSPTILPIEEKK